MKTYWILAILIVVGLSACIPSLHPLVTEENAITFDEVIGRYTTKDGIWEFERSLLGKQLYTMATGDDAESLKSKYLVNFTRLNGRVFADFYPVRHIANLDLSTDYLPTHMFARVSVTAQGLQFDYTDGDRLKTMFKEGRVRLKHEQIGDDDILITASSKDLARFMEQHGGDDRLFDLNYELERMD
jgi:hypothetical protein